MAGRDRRPSADEADLWRKVTGDVKPISKSAADLAPPGLDPAAPAAPAKAASPRRRAKTPCRAASGDTTPPPAATSMSKNSMGLEPPMVRASDSE